MTPLFFSTLYKTHEPRTCVLYCPLSRTVRSLMACEKQMSAYADACFSLRSIKLTNHALACSTVRCRGRVRSLMACEKQMSAMQTLVFLYAHNIPEKALYFHIFTNSKSVQIPHRCELHLPLFPFHKRYAAVAQYLKIWRLPSRHF